MFTNKNITIFGGTGSIGTVIAKKLLSLDCCNQITLFSNSENELWQARNIFGVGPKPFENIQLTFGDIRDKKAVDKVVKYSDIVFNCAALKHIGFCEASPTDAVFTNLIGLQNIIDACNKYHLELMVQISTDKAVEPSSVMGATKLIGERMCKDNGCPKKIIRLGNVLGSRGSLIPQLEAYLKQGNKIYITDPKMNRFFINQDDLADFVMEACNHLTDQQANIYIPKMIEYNIMDVVNDFLDNIEGGHDVEIEVFGAGKAEKFTEALYSQTEANTLIEFDHMYVIGGSAHEI